MPDHTWFPPDPGGDQEVIRVLSVLEYFHKTTTGCPGNQLRRILQQLSMIHSAQTTCTKLGQSGLMVQAAGECGGELLAS